MPPFSSSGGWVTVGRTKNPSAFFTDVAPWFGRYSSDTCNAVIAGEPPSQQREMFAIV